MAGSRPLLPARSSSIGAGDRLQGLRTPTDAAVELAGLRMRLPRLALGRLANPPAPPNSSLAGYVFQIDADDQVIRADDPDDGVVGASA